MRGKRVSTTVYFDPRHVDGLRRLQARTRVTPAQYVREALDDLLVKYEALLRLDGVRHPLDLNDEGSE